MIPAIIAGASALGSLAVGAYNSYKQSENATNNNKLARQTYELNLDTLDWNKQMANRDFEYNKQLQDTIFQREDSAVQRMVADNRAAGLSPIAGLAGASAGQALEANTPQLNQNVTAPQLTAQQLQMDFSSLGNFADQLHRMDLDKKGLELKQEALELEKSSNEANLRDLEEKIRGTKLDNQLKAATLDSKIKGANLANQKVEKEIQKAGVDIISQTLGNEIKELSKIQTRREMAEWLENKGLRAELGDRSLEKIKEDILTSRLQKEIASGKFTEELKILKENAEGLRMKNQSSKDVEKMFQDLGFGNSAEGRLGGTMLKMLWDLFTK